ncbi:MAG TPA: LacI family DNA-binding transcriptional regulator [Ktedonobacterales bacterium]
MNNTPPDPPVEARAARPTLAQLAHVAGVNKSTASRALRGDTAIALATRTRIQQLARELGYEPNASARRLFYARTDVIAFTLHDFRRLESGSDPFIAELLEAVLNEAASHQLDVLICRPQPGTAELDSYHRIVGGHHVDGVIVMDLRPGDPRITYLCAQRFPHVLFGRSSLEVDQAREYPYPWVEVDNRAGARMGTEHLLALGHRRIAFLGCGDVYTFELDRRAGYQDALAASGIPYADELCTPSGASQEDGCRLTTELLAMADPPTAIFAVSDVLAVGAMRALRDAGRTVGADFPVMGFDGLGLGAYLQPQLTTIRQPLGNVGRALVRLLVATLRSESPPEHVMLPPELIVRASTVSG